MTRKLQFPPPPTHRFAGSSKARQEVGKPGHCESCAQLGHIAGHPNLGCDSCHEPCCNPTTSPQRKATTR